MPAPRLGCLLTDNNEEDIIQNIRYSEKNKLKHLISMDNDENFEGIYSQKELIRKGKKLIEEGN